MMTWRWPTRAMRRMSRHRRRSGVCGLIFVDHTVAIDVDMLEMIGRRNEELIQRNHAVTICIEVHQTAGRRKRRW